MGISSALYSGVSGLNTNSQAMTVIGNNLANTNTLGFKCSRTVFSDLLASTINGSGGTSQVGRGVNMSKVDNIFSQGTFESTESGLDVAIEGDGFFMVSEVGTDAVQYTRAGAFRFDEAGYLINPEGFRVQGKPYDVNGVLVAGDPEDIQIANTGLIPGNPTDEMTLTTNLDAAASTPTSVAEVQSMDLSTVSVAAGESLTFTIDGQNVVYTNGTAGALTGAALVADIQGSLGTVADIGNGTGYTFAQDATTTTQLNITQTAGSESNIVAITTANTTPANGQPSGAETAAGVNATFNYLDPATFNYSSSTQVFDSLGEPHLLTTYFTKVGSNTWEWYWSAEDSNGAPFGSAISGTPSGTLSFNPDGSLASGGGPNTTPAINWNNGSDPTQVIDVVFNTTQFDSASTVISQEQNGYGAGNLTSVDIDGEGVVIASYSNGEQIKVASLVLAKFNNPNGLALVGNNLFEATETSGSPRVGLPGSELGKVFTNSLEQSNVDMGAEFVRMITVQRGFQANSKIITTVDELLGELINLKR